MAKSEVYSWRAAPDAKSRLEHAAQRERRSVAALLDEIVTDHLNAREGGDDHDEQQRRHARVARCAGCISGSDRNRSARLATRASDAR
jgi:hypothetical protein